MPGVVPFRNAELARNIGKERPPVTLIRGPEGANDYSKARELIRMLAGMERGESEYQPVLDKLDGEAWNKAASLVEKYAKQIDALSRVWREKLGGLSEFELSGDEISNIPCFKELETGSEI
jgi:hypothetical protein